MATDIDRKYKRIREKVKHWKGWSKWRVFIYSLLWRVATKKLREIFKETRGLIPDPSEAPDEIEK